MSNTYSSDLRERAVVQVNAGHSRREVARRFGVSPSFVVKLMQLVAETGSTTAAKRGRPFGPLMPPGTRRWRVLAPRQLAFRSATRLGQVRTGSRQINQLMQLTPERDPNRPVTQQRIFHGAVKFDRVSVRYNANANPALLGVSFAIEPGEILAITGPSGSGKSTILKLVAGLVQLQAGNVMVDGLDIRQLDPGELRRSIAYVPQRRVLFHGTVAQNLRFADPTASDEVIEQACRDADVLDEINAMAQGMDTRFGDHNIGKLPGGFQQLMVLARAYVRRAPLLLLDEPASNLDNDGDAALMKMLKKLRGLTTIIMVTHRPSHMRLADRRMYLDRGRVMLSGPPEDVIARMFEPRPQTSATPKRPKRPPHPPPPHTGTPACRPVVRGPPSARAAQRRRLPGRRTSAPSAAKPSPTPRRRRSRKTTFSGTTAARLRS